MAYGELTAIAGDYPSASQDALLELAESYRRRNEREILELAAIAADIAADDIISLGLEPDTNRQLLEAYRRYTNKDFDSLVGQSAEYLEKFRDGLKGIYFEVLVRDRLNAGETLGELKLDNGQYARLGPPSKEGWDLEIIDRQGDLVENLQLKATTAMKPVRDALKEYEDFRVVVPEELDSTADDIIGTSIPHEDIEQPTTAQVEEWSEGAIADSVDNAAELELLVDIIPVTSALVIVVIEGRRWLTGRATLKEATRSGGGRLARSTAYGGIGTVLSATGLGAAAIPVVMGIRLAHNRLAGQINLQSNLQTRTAELQLA